LLAALLCLGTPARAAFEVNDRGWQGTSELLELARTRLGRERVQIVATLDYEALAPADGLLIMHPEVDLEYEEVSAFLRAGGRVAVMDDYGTGDRLLARFKIHRVRAPLRPAESLRDNHELAIALPAVQRVAGHEQGRHPIVADVQKLVTNHPTALSHPNLTPVLEIPALGEPNATLAVTGIIVKRGRLFAMGDASAVINLMLRYPGNRAFATGLLDYLVEDDVWGRRGGKLYLVTNRFRQRGHFGGETTLAGEVREQLEGIAETLGDVHNGGLPESLVTLLAVLTALGAMAWVGVVAARPYRRSTPRYAAQTPLVAQGGAAGRAAVLAAGTTHRALVVLELKSALEEGLCERLRLSPATRGRLLLGEVERRKLLGRASFEKLARMMADMGSAEDRVAASQAPRVSVAEVQRMHRDMLDLLADIDRALETRR
jgi:hypothetical protein